MPENICRICLSPPKPQTRFVSVHDIYELLAEKQTFAQIFLLTSGFRIEDDEPQNLCSVCRLELVNCARFILKCKRAQQHFKKFVSIPDIYSNQLKAEKPKEEEKTHPKCQAPVFNDDTDGSDDFTFDDPSDFNTTSNSVGQGTSISKHSVTTKNKISDFIDMTNDSENSDADENVKKKPKRGLTCELCTENTRTYETMTDLNRHQRKVHKPRQRCPYCNGEYSYSYVDDHKFICKLNPINGNHLPENTLLFKCQYCEDPDLRPKPLGSYENHLRKYHPDNKTAACQYCTKLCYPDLIKYHEEDCTKNPKHTKEPPEDEKLPCTYCGKQIKATFLHSHVLTVHTNPKDGKRYICDLCPDKSYVRKDDLVCHMKIKHNKEEIAELCSLCGLAFRSKAHLKIHLRRVHTELYPLLECDQCTYKTAEPGSLITHKRMHLGEAAKRHTCEICLKKFHKTCELKKHMLVHTDQKDFACDQCGSSFKSNTNLKNHKSRVHAIVKGYECPVCGRDFSTNQCNRNHIQKEHPEYPLPPPGTVMKRNPMNNYINSLLPLSSRMKNN